MDIQKYFGKTISAAHEADDKLILRFSDGFGVAIYDNGQSCCEHRHMTTDDDIQSLVGSVLTRVDEKAGPEIAGEEVHETCFVEIGTNTGFITIVNHNEHNGYYGGFSIETEDLK